MLPSRKPSSSGDVQVLGHEVFASWTLSPGNDSNIFRAPSLHLLSAAMPKSWLSCRSGWSNEPIGGVCLPLSF